MLVGNEALITREGQLPDVLDVEFMKRFAAIRQVFSDASKARRRSKTSKSKIKQREGGGGKTFRYVDRPDYQIWLNEHFPGWSCEDMKFWTERAKYDNQDVPVLFCVSFTLVVTELGERRRIPAIGTAPVSEKELGKSNTQLFKNKYTTALTEAFKTACNWLDAFFDLRADEDAREAASQPPSDSEQKEFDETLKKIPDEHHAVVNDLWKKQNATSARKFLDELKIKVRQFETVQPKPQGATNV